LKSGGDYPFFSFPEFVEFISFSRFLVK